MPQMHGPDFEFDNDRGGGDGEKAGSRHAPGPPRLDFAEIASASDLTGLLARHSSAPTSVKLPIGGRETSVKLDADLARLNSIGEMFGAACGLRARETTLQHGVAGSAVGGWPCAAGSDVHTQKHEMGSRVRVIVPGTAAGPRGAPLIVALTDATGKSVAITCALTLESKSVPGHGILETIVQLFQEHASGVDDAVGITPHTTTLLLPEYLAVAVMGLVQFLWGLKTAVPHGGDVTVLNPVWKAVVLRIVHALDVACSIRNQAMSALGPTKPTRQPGPTRPARPPRPPRHVSRASPGCAVSVQDLTRLLTPGFGPAPMTPDEVVAAVKTAVNSHLELEAVRRALKVGTTALIMPRVARLLQETHLLAGKDAGFKMSGKVIKAFTEATRRRLDRRGSKVKAATGKLFHK